MNQTETGMLIRTLRQKKGITQLELAEMIGVSDKAVSKWERGRGLPDIEFFPKLDKALNVDSETLLRGVIETNSASNGNMKKMNFFVCPKCGNLLFSTDDADISCCGEKLSPLKAKKRRTVRGSSTSILGKTGVSGIDSGLGTSICTMVVLVMAWLIVFFTGKGSKVTEIPIRELVFICLSG